MLPSNETGGAMVDRKVDHVECHIAARASV